MTFAGLITTIRQGVEDINSTLYLDPEVLEAANHALQHTVVEMRNLDPQFKMVGKTELTFGSSDTEITLPSNFESILYAEDGLNNRINIVDISRKDDPVYYQEKYTYLDNDGVWYIGRRKSGSSETINIWYKAKLSDESTVSSTSSLVFLAQPADRLVKVRAELILLGNRNRKSRIKEIEEVRLSNTVMANISRNLPEPEMVAFIDPE